MEMKAMIPGEGIPVDGSPVLVVPTPNSIVLVPHCVLEFQTGAKQVNDFSPPPFLGIGILIEFSIKWVPPPSFSSENINVANAGFVRLGVLCSQPLRTAYLPA